jgi:DNA (cytosine-5)-methyltransferase 1
MQDNIKLYFRGQRRPEVFPLRGTNNETLKQIIGGSQGDMAYDPSGVSCTLASQAGGKGAKTGLYLLNGTREGNTYCLDANYAKGELRLDKSKRTMVEVRPVLTPDRPEKRQNGRRMKEDGEPMFTLTAQDRHGVMIKVPALNKQGYVKATEGDGLILSRTHQTFMPVMKQISHCLRAGNTKDVGVVQNTRIRRLTPKECFRLQGFPDEYFERARAVNSDSQLYKQAGNAVSVPVIYEIARRLK